MGSKIKDVKLVKVEDSLKCRYFLDCTYLVSNPYRDVEIHIPRAVLRISDTPVITHAKDRHLDNEVYADLGFGNVLLLKDDDGRVYTETIVREKPQRMTLSQIEKKLGYKIELVSEKEV